MLNKKVVVSLLHQTTTKNSNMKTMVRIKTKGQFFGMVGEVVKILNQHQVVVKFPNVQGVFNFSHRAIELVSTPIGSHFDEKVAKIVSNAAKQDTLNVLHRLREDHEKKLAYTKQYTSDYAKGYVNALEWAIQAIIVEETRL